MTVCIRVNRHSDLVRRPEMPHFGLLYTLANLDFGTIDIQAPFSFQHYLTIQTSL
jgi:hypothetical protein